MASNAERAATLVRALEASIVGDSGVIGELYTDDVKGWAPALTVSSAAELAVEFEERDGAAREHPQVAVGVESRRGGGAHRHAVWQRDGRRHRDVVHRGRLLRHQQRGIGRPLRQRGAGERQNDESECGDSHGRTLYRFRAV